VKPTERLEEAVTPDGTVLSLFRHDGHYYLRANGIELMSTRRHHSEEKLAELACADLRTRSDARVFIGGLGFGFTLKAALRVLSPGASVVVAELLADVIAWNRNPAYALAGDALADPRVTVRQEDAVNALARAAGSYDAILLDVDNGAESFTTAGNARLYDGVGIEMAIAALRPNGRLAYWSDRDDPRFARALRDAGLRVETARVRAHATSGAWHTLLVARRG
jgi:spermidine synthase